MNMTELGRKARTASKALAIASKELKNAVLIKIADSLENQSEPVLAANDQDLLQGRQDGLSEALLDRLRLDSARLTGIATDLRAVASLPDPVGEIFDKTILPNGLRVHKQRVPLGVLGVIYEARPNVTIDVAGLALKSGNAAILRGGSETQNSNRALVNLIQVALAEVELPPDSVLFVNDPDRQRVLELLQMHEYVDMLIPRGGAALHQFCRENSRIPVITGGIGICHLYVDDSADLESALKVVQNAKVQRPTVCNALDTVLVHRTVAAGFLPRLVSYLEKDGVKFRVNSSAIQYLREANLGLPASVQVAGPQDFDTEWLSLVLGLMVVDDLDQAIEHIALHSTGHSDGILTRDDRNARRFVAQVDSAVVYVNASTRFTDGSQLGLGAEVAISTQRLHARGPMALRELTTYKWVVRGDYHVRK
jgi:glutamate-5-semialdehyde dehydrogenase